MLNIKRLSSLVGTVVETTGIGKRYKNLKSGKFVETTRDKIAKIIKNFFSRILALSATNAKNKKGIPVY
ncbi:hypothetical protein, partial [Sutterella massiliensis]|uniref:hypothetical protein n=1 Tax=Sutterella massiliensis TaxID=1816689 RepID=UPI001961C7DC